ncbi:hypothetical protein HK102_007827, partial [Quaeritorhiza haematococci]
VLRTGSAEESGLELAKVTTAEKPASSTGDGVCGNRGDGASSLASNTKAPSNSTIQLKEVKVSPPRNHTTTTTSLLTLTRNFKDPKQITAMLSRPPSEIKSRNYQKQLPIHLFCSNSHTGKTHAYYRHVLPFLTDSFSKEVLNSPDRDHQTPLALALMRDAHDWVNGTWPQGPSTSSLSYNANFDSKHIPSSQKELDSLKNAIPRPLHMTEYLISNGATMSAKDAQGRTVLHHYLGNWDGVKPSKMHVAFTVLFWVWFGGVDVNAVDQDAQTALDVLVGLVHKQGQKGEKERKGRGDGESASGVAKGVVKEMERLLRLLGARTAQELSERMRQQQQKVVVKQKKSQQQLRHQPPLQKKAQDRAQEAQTQKGKSGRAISPAAASSQRRRSVEEGAKITLTINRELDFDTPSVSPSAPLSPVSQPSLSPPQSPSPVIVADLDDEDLSSPSDLPNSDYTVTFKIDAALPASPSESPVEVADLLPHIAPIVMPSVQTASISLDDGTPVFGEMNDSLCSVAQAVVVGKRKRPQEMLSPVSDNGDEEDELQPPRSPKRLVTMDSSVTSTPTTPATPPRVGEDDADESASRSPKIIFNAESLVRGYPFEGDADVVTLGTENDNDVDLSGGGGGGDRSREVSIRVVISPPQHHPSKQPQPEKKEMESRLGPSSQASSADLSLSSSPSSSYPSPSGRVRQSVKSTVPYWTFGGHSYRPNHKDRPCMVNFRGDSYSRRSRSRPSRRG